MKLHFYRVFILICVIAFLATCKKDNDPDPVRDDPAKHFVTILNDSLKDRGFGYSFAVFKRNELLGSGAGGLQARKQETGQDKAVTLDTKMQIASMTKTLTAAAFLKLAKEKGIRTSDKIVGYLPKNWVIGPNVELITFKDLLTHTSGIVGLGENCRNGAYGENIWDGLKALIAKGITKENRGQFCYQNANFGLFRVLIPVISGLQMTGGDTNDAFYTSRSYEDYVRKNLLEKAGVVTGEFLLNGMPTPTYGFDFPYSGEFGFDPGDFTSTTGGYGVYLSANDAIKVYDALFSPGNSAVITQEIRDELLSGGLGNYSAVMPEGKFSYHDGWWYSGYGLPNPKGFRSVWMHCPEDITVVLFTNALRNSDGLFPIRSAFYQDITSYVLWAFSQYKNPERGKRMAPVNFHDYLEHPEPH
nr:serine hydrolase domain-containing protein [uncultured Dyadobacter sp.]